MTKIGQVVAVLHDGPATTEEVAIETGLPVQLASTHLSNAYRKGRIAKRPFGTVQLWMLKDHAQVWNAKSR